MTRITIFHTNDFHNRLTDSQAARLATLRRDIGDGGLLLDAGDAISAGNVTFRPGGEPILDTMSEIGYDAMTIGNREFHFTRHGFFAKLSRARFPALCANVRSVNPEEPSLPVFPSIRAVAAGVRVTVFGLTVPMITERMLARKVSGFVFDDPLGVAEGLVPTLRPEADLLVCLSHIGLKRDRQLAALCPDIDLIIGGHTHAVLPEGEFLGDTLIVQAASFGRLFGTVTAEFEQGRRRLAAKLEPL